MEWILNLYEQFSSLSELDQFKLVTGNVTVYSSGAVAALAYVSIRYKNNLLIFISLLGLIIYGALITFSAAYMILDLKERVDAAKSIIDGRSKNLIIKALFPEATNKRQYNPETNTWEEVDFNWDEFDQTLENAVGCGFSYIPQAKRIVYKSHGTFLRSIEIVNDLREDKNGTIGHIEDIIEWPDYEEKGHRVNSP